MNTNQDSVSHRDEAKSPCQSQETGKVSSRSEWIRQNSIDVQPAEQGKKHAAHRLDNAQTTNCSAGRIQSGLLGAGFWARSGNIYEGGYRTERAAINAVKRRLHRLSPQDGKGLTDSRENKKQTNP